ncbi:hypothetical protein [uncultured Cardiobacterium sp.]|uniref:hypothetical protein n=1 Tax=uncultured Cardiobacterium sp. TaxID=417619 RepID=UPI002627B0AD|nr:hypothetical protein [uncultured Cardiobacterium sp.]
MGLWILLWIMVSLTVLGVIGVVLAFFNEVLFEPLYGLMADWFWTWQAKRDRHRREAAGRLEKARFEAEQKQTGRHPLSRGLPL